MKKISALLLFVLPAFVSNSADTSGLFADPAASRPTVALPAPALPIGRTLTANVSMVMRLRHESPKVNGITRIDHGTGALLDGLILTARHVVEGEGTTLCEVDGKWVPCRMIADDPDIDIAVLEPLSPIKPAGYTAVDGCHSSVKGTPIAVLPARKVSTLWMNIQGFHHGASGSPVIQNGRVIAVAVAMRSEIESNSVQIVPAVMLQEIWELARQKSTVAIAR